MPRSPGRSCARAGSRRPRPSGCGIDGRRVCPRRTSALFDATVSMSRRVAMPWIRWGSWAAAVAHPGDERPDDPGDSGERCDQDRDDEPSTPTADRPGAPRARAGMAGSASTRSPLATPRRRWRLAGHERRRPIPGARERVRARDTATEPDQGEVDQFVVRRCVRAGFMPMPRSGATVCEVRPSRTRPPRVAARSAGGRLIDGVAVGVGRLAGDDVGERDLLAGSEPGAGERGRRCRAGAGSSGAGAGGSGGVAMSAYVVPSDSRTSTRTAVSRSVVISSRTDRRSSRPRRRSAAYGSPSRSTDE